MIVLLILLFYNSWNYYHPVHITITNVDYYENESKFEIKIKIFSDDLENIIQKKTGINIGLTTLTISKKTEPYLIEYISENFNLFVNNKNKPLINKSSKFTYEIKDGAILIDVSIKISEKVRTLKIYNNLLNDLYDDMKNMLIINWKNQEKGIIFAKNKTEEILE